MPNFEEKNGETPMIGEKDILAELVESQLDEIAGGGYSEWNVSHLKD